MGTTTKFGYPYPEPTDPVAAGADNIKALAQAIDVSPANTETRLWGAAAVNGRLLIQASEMSATTNVNGAVTWTYPIPYATPPCVIVVNGDYGTSVPQVAFSTITGANCVVQFRDIGSGALVANTTVRWIYQLIGIR